MREWNSSNSCHTRQKKQTPKKKTHVFFVSDDLFMFDPVLWFSSWLFKWFCELFRASQLIRFLEPLQLLCCVFISASGVTLEEKAWRQDQDLGDTMGWIQEFHQGVSQSDTICIIIWWGIVPQEIHWLIESGSFFRLWCWSTRIFCDGQGGNMID